MSRLDDVREFYCILGELAARLGGSRRLCGCDGRMPWPTLGVYFFFEEGEDRSNSGVGPRVVRVGTHALTSTSTATLWKRLSQHRGTAGSTGGNHRGSIFRLLVGEALIRRDQVVSRTWGAESDAGAAARRFGVTREGLRDQERALELVVSRAIGAMPFVWVEVDDAPGHASLRGVIERNSIALLSNFGRDPIDVPSDRWLGRHSARDRVRTSGLWNNNHVDENYDPGFLAALCRAARTTTTTVR
jgi:hypothetical protein